MKFIWKGNIGKAYSLNTSYEYYFYGLTFKEFGIGFIRRARRRIGNNKKL